MMHWAVSSALGLLLTGQWRPVCSLIHCAPDCMARRAFMRAADRVFGEVGHCGRIHDTWAIGRALRG